MWPPTQAQCLGGMREMCSVTVKAPGKSGLTSNISLVDFRCAAEETGDGRGLHHLTGMIHDTLGGSSVCGFNILLLFNTLTMFFLTC
jgi:hypothetical protein